jgi:hypothetical protein
MATDIVGGLFGMTPQSYQAQQNQQALAQSEQLGQLDPFALARTGLIYGGRQIGGAIAGALGGQDPQLQLISARNAILRGTNMSDANALQSAASQLANIGDIQGAYGLAELAQKRAESEATIGLREAQAKKANEWKMMTGVSERNRELIASANTKLGKNEKLTPEEESSLRVQVAQEMKPKSSIAPSGEVITIDPLNLNIAAPNVAKYLGLIPAQTTSGGGGGAPTSGTSTGAGGGGVGVRVTQTPMSTEALAKEKETAVEAVNSVKSSISNVDKALNLYQSSPNIAGGWGAALLGGVPNTEAKALKNLNDAIKAAFSVTEIEKLKAQSKTGATGFGSLAVKELETIQNAATALDPSDKNYPQQLQIIKDSFQRWKDIMEGRTQRIEQRMGGTTPSQVPNLQSTDIAPKKSPNSGRNPQLQPEASNPKIKKWSEL